MIPDKCLCNQGIERYESLLIVVSFCCYSKSNICDYCNDNFTKICSDLFRKPITPVLIWAPHH